MEGKLNKMAYETPSLDELYLCPVVQGGASKFTEVAEDVETSYNEEEVGM